MKIAFFDINGWEKPILRSGLKGNSLKFFEEKLSEKNAGGAKEFEIISVFAFSKVDKNILNKLPKLKLIATRSTGFDHIDLKECKKRKITVCNVPTYGANTVAEHTFALILALSRKIYKSHLRRLSGDYSIEGLKGFDLEGKTIGVIGVGNIGRHVVRIARGFGMNILGVDRHPDKFIARELNFKYVSFAEALKESDIISLHVPYTRENHHFIGRKEINLMKKGAIIINTARGDLLDTEALIKGLESRKIYGAGLDVLEGEKLIKEEKQILYDEKKAVEWKQLVENHILLSKENVVFTPHIAFYSEEALRRIIDMTITNILCFLGKKTGSECSICH